MKTTLPKQTTELDEIIAMALKKIGGTEENDLCKFLPGNSGGYIHHFTLRKMKQKQPVALSEMIKKFIVQTDRPGRLEPKQRAPRGSRKKKDILALSKNDVERVLQLARQAGDSVLIGKLSPKRSMTRLKKELTKSIKAGQINEELWQAYIDGVRNQMAPFATACLPS